MLALLLRIALGLIFIYAAWTKLREPWELFALAISTYNLLPLKAVEFVARTLPWFELVIGLMLLVGWGLRISTTICSLLLVVFFSLLVRAFIQGTQVDCGCFGSGDPLTWKSLLRDGSMLAGSLLLTWTAFRRQPRTA